MIKIAGYTKKNYEEAMEMTVRKDQRDFVPSVLESLALAYVKPWDEAFDPYLIFDDDQMIGGFYLSYTPESEDNYWLGGFFIKEKSQGKGYGKRSLLSIIEFLKTKHLHMQVLSLTLVKSNKIARSLYEGLGFVTDGKANREGELIFKLHFDK